MYSVASGLGQGQILFPGNSGDPAVGKHFIVRPNRRPFDLRIRLPSRFKPVIFDLTHRLTLSDVGKLYPMQFQPQRPGGPVAFPNRAINTRLPLSRHAGNRETQIPQ
jgi:hypothetical protein